MFELVKVLDRGSSRSVRRHSRKAGWAHELGCREFIAPLEGKLAPGTRPCRFCALCVRCWVASFGTLVPVLHASVVEMHVGMRARWSKLPWAFFTRGGACLESNLVCDVVSGFVGLLFCLSGTPLFSTTAVATVWYEIVIFC